MSKFLVAFYAGSTLFTSLAAIMCSSPLLGLLAALNFGLGVYHYLLWAEEPLPGETNE